MIMIRSLIDTPFGPIGVSRETLIKIAGDRPRNQPIGFSRMLWVDRITQTAYYREVNF